MQRAELKQLQSQINPHFLYNSFFAINTMAKTGDENLAIFTKRLGEYFQFITRNSSDKICLSEEVKHAKVYTEIQLMRFSLALQIQFGEYPERYSELKVPRLILQPIIENAFNHGLKELESSRIISVNFKENENELDIIVEDNGCGMTDAGIFEMENALTYKGNDIETTGIINIHRRIRLEYGQNSGVLVSKSEMGGLKVILRIEIPFSYELGKDYQNQ
jgi:two-component system sensor histidine kinase YesM